MKIGKLAKAVGCSVDAIRFYEQKGIMPRPLRSEGGFRLYTDEHVQRLSFICYCRSLDISLEEIKLLLSLDAASKLINYSIDIFKISPNIFIVCNIYA